ncbi:MAG: FkbM family methyltransferase [Mesorhizobium sp.]|nr:MAG: FkbM family methyltransferase [Mesorhizobium sp.]
MSLMTVHGVKVPLRPDDVSPVIWQALDNETYEAKEAKWISKAVKPGDRVLELGSGIGIITSLIAQIPDVQVWAFEANPASVALAQRVVDANDLDNVVLLKGILAAGPPRPFTFYLRKDLWMSSMDKDQGPYEREMTIVSTDADDFIVQHGANVLVMDIEGAERELLQHAKLPGIERVFLELHDHLYGLDGIRDITQALALKGYAYDPRGSRGPCVLFAKDDGPREYEEVEPDAA